jgi:hypothetical protein
MAQVLAWIRDHSSFLAEEVQPVLDRVKGEQAPSAQVQFSNVHTYM